MYPVFLLLALMVFTWIAAVVATYLESEEPESNRDARVADEDYHEAA